MVLKEMRLMGVIIAVLFIIAGTALAQQESQASSMSLKGAEALYVKVSNLDPDLKERLSKESITEAILRSEIERRLKAKGIKAMAEEQFRKTGKENCLYLKIEIAAIEPKSEYIKIADSTKLPPTKFIYRLRLEFRQEVALARNAGIKVMATTWMKDDFGYRRLSLIHDAALSLTDMFIQDFLSENR